MSEVRELSRRSLLKRGGVVGGALFLPSLLAACGSADNSGSSTKKMQAVFADYGGTTRDERIRVYGAEFKKRHGGTLEFADADAGRFVLQAERKRGLWDMYDADGFEAIDYQQRGLLEKLPNSVPRSDLVDPAFQDYTSGGFAYSFIQAYSPDAITSTKPETWEDFWNVSKFPGKRAWPKYYIATAEPALMADGVGMDAMYPLDLDRAFAKMNELRSNMLFYESYAQGVQMVASGAAVMGMLPNGRVFDASRNGEPVAPVWNQAVLLPWEGPVIPKGAPHADGAFALISIMADPKLQAEFAKATSYAPTVSAAYDYLEASETEFLANSPEHKAVALTADTAAVAAQNSDLATGYSEWLAGA